MAENSTIIERSETLWIQLQTARDAARKLEWEWEQMQPELITYYLDNHGYALNEKLFNTYAFREKYPNTEATIVFTIKEATENGVIVKDGIGIGWWIAWEELPLLRRENKTPEKSAESAD